ncbi:MAG: ribbon-helix-helix domain-containing protein [Candidatus Sulfotelmatobacter sp.]
MNKESMPQAEITRLTIVWSKDTDLALRSYLGAQGLKKGALSKFVEDAVKWRLFDQTVNQAREAFASVPAGELRDTIDDAILSVRKQRRRLLRGRPRK